MPSGELAREREYVGTLYARLDELREEAQQQLEAVRRSTPGGTHQNRSERDAFARIYEDRVLQLRQIDERLAFGNILHREDAVAVDAGASGLDSATAGRGGFGGHRRSLLV